MIIKQLTLDVHDVILLKNVIINKSTANFNNYLYKN